MRKANKPGRNVFAGQAEASALVHWLNGDTPEDQKQLPVRKRISHLIDNMNINADLFIRHSKPNPTLTARIDREFSRYPLRVETVHVLDTGRYKSFPESRWIFRWSCSGGSRVASMMLAIVRLGERGLLSRIRLCKRCTRWFFAKFNHQRFCQVRCQVLHYQTGEYWKQRRRERHESGF
jgi:hypothetical protein